MNNTIFLGKRNLKSSNTANTVGIWSLHDINEMRHYDFITATAASRTVIVTFKESGSWLCPTGVTEVEYLVIAGGAGGVRGPVGGQCPTRAHSRAHSAVSADRSELVEVAGPPQARWPH